MEEMPISKRLTWAIIHGILGMIYYVLIYIYIIPVVFSFLASKMSSNIPTVTSGELAGLALFFLGLSSASSGLKGTIYNPLLRAFSNIFGFFILVYFMNGGEIAGTVTIGGGRIGMYIDLAPIIYVAFAFITIPGIIIPFYDYFTKDMAGAG
jgi:pheromone shutdown protein TraB